jgi:hypothetical protein
VSTTHACGLQVLLQHAGEDITQLFDGALGGHVHSKAARAILNKYERPVASSAQPTAAAGSQAQGPHMPSNTDSSDNGAPIDESKPLLQQVIVLQQHAMI